MDFKEYRMRIEAVLFDLFDTLLLIGNDEVYYPSCLKSPISTFVFRKHCKS